MRRGGTTEWEGSRERADSHVMKTGLSVSQVTSVPREIPDAMSDSVKEIIGSVGRRTGLVIERLWPYGIGKIAGRQKSRVPELVEEWNHWPPGVGPEFVVVI